MKKLALAVLGSLLGLCTVLVQGSEVDSETALTARSDQYYDEMCNEGHLCGIV